MPGGQSRVRLARKNEKNTNTPVPLRTEGFPAEYFNDYQAETLSDKQASPCDHNQPDDPRANQQSYRRDGNRSHSKTIQLAT